MSFVPDNQARLRPQLLPAFPPSGPSRCPDLSNNTCFTNYGWRYTNVTFNPRNGGLDYTVCDPVGRCRRFTSQQYPTFSWR